MFKASYVELSRHYLFYFRYPLPRYICPNNKPKHIRISLGTRDSKEALRLANMLEYHAKAIFTHNDLKSMNYTDIITILKDHFYNLLDAEKEKIREQGPLSIQNQEQIEQDLNHAIKAIQDNDNSKIGDKPISEYIEPIIQASGFEIKQGSKEYDILASNYKEALSGYCKNLLKFNHDTFQFTFTTRPDAMAMKRSQGKSAKPEDRLGKVIDGYISEMIRSGVWGIRAEEERRSCCDVLIEILGDGYNVPAIDSKVMRHVKDMISKLPKNREKNPKTRGREISEQIKIEGVEKLSVTSVNKYITIYSGLFDWAKDNGHIQENPFKGALLKVKGGENRRKKLNAKESLSVLERLEKSASKTFQYWGVLIAFYTGARLNEIASLTPDDIKNESGIWYFDFNDEGEMKRLKTDAAKRKTPIHEKLIELGILDYVDKVKAMEGDNLRLLPDLTFNRKEGWGRKLGRWFNDNLLPDLGIKREGVSFHSIRHTVITKLRRANVELPIVQTAVGHERDSVTEVVYNHGYELAQLQEAINKLKY